MDPELHLDLYRQLQRGLRERRAIEDRRVRRGASANRPHAEDLPTPLTNRLRRVRGRLEAVAGPTSRSASA
jgi:hypothetical protein